MGANEKAFHQIPINEQLTFYSHHTASIIGFTHTTKQTAKSPKINDV